MLKIDSHNHILPSFMPDFKARFGHGGFITLKEVPGHPELRDMVRDDGVFFRRVEENCLSLEARLKEMDEFDVDVQVLSTVPVLFCYWAPGEESAIVARFLNTDIAEKVARYPKRFVGLASVPMQDPAYAVKELRYAIEELGLAGVQIGSHIGDVNLDSDTLTEFFATCEELNAAVMVHPWDMMGKETMPDYWLPWLVGMPAETTRAICSMIFGGVFDRHPKLKVMFAHGGGSFPGTLGRIEHGFNVRPDLCATKINKSPRTYIDRFYIDSITHDERALQYILDLMGPKQVMLGTDYPFPLGELTPGRLIESMKLEKDVQARLLGGTALEWLGMEPSRFQ